jgi:hypothetical protein
MRKSNLWWSLTVLVALGVGWLMGGAGRSSVELDRRAAVERAGFAEARIEILSGRLALYQVNFGDAARRFDAAAQIVGSLQGTMRDLSQAERAGRLDTVLTHLREAQRLSTSVDPAAQGAAEQALAALEAASASDER